ncbi:MAG: universal stress protein [Thiobacillus sp.]|nr:MAG: universal stress protein [Thiobacillus sp. SCN 63-374]OZA29400.1 MAG: universal stress protein [Hydrogenophilales bacterium 17-64-11]
MNPLHTLLAATDLSAPARHAAQRAALLARDINARLELAHVLEQGALDELRRWFGAEGEALQARIREQAREALAQLAADVGAPLGVSAGTHLLEGAVLERIAAEADRLDASLLIVGARGAGFMRHWLLGATAERLLRKTRRPILVVKQPAREAYRSVLVPVDFSPWSRGAIRLARAVAPQAEIVLLHAFDAPFEGKLRIAGVAEETIRRHRTEAREEALTRLHQAAAEAGLAAADWRALAVHGDAAPRILEQEEEQGADLIVLGKHGAGMTEELLLGSVTKHVLAHSRGDVLVAWR